MIFTPHCFPRLVTHLALAFFLVASVTGLLAQQAGTSPVKIFILAGQSNMEGQGEVSPVATPGTLRHTVANDPAVRRWPAAQKHSKFKTVMSRPLGLALSPLI